MYFFDFNRTFRQTDFNIEISNDMIVKYDNIALSRNVIVERLKVLAHAVRRITWRNVL